MTKKVFLVLVRQKGLPLVTFLGNGDVLGAGAESSELLR